MLNNIIKFFLENRLVTGLLFLAFILWGVYTAPFNWQTSLLGADPVPVDAIPDLGENQQIIYTQWPGRSPQDIEDQISYPLTSYLLGIPGVRSIRSTSTFGFSSIYIIFDEEKEFYWTRARIVEKLSAIPESLLPEGAQASLGPDATALGQVFWYTIEGRDESGQVTGSWDLHEIRKVQDFYLKHALSSIEGVAEVASIGGFVQEYQVIADPAALQSYDISLSQIMKAVQESNTEVGAKTIELNQVEYLVRGIGYVKNLEDLEQAVIEVKNNTPIRISDVAQVRLGPANRRGVLDKEGAEVVGGVVVARYGANPMEVIDNLKEKIENISAGLPSKTLSDGSLSKLTIVPFYDRSELIQETLGTLEEALILEILITILVVIIVIYRLRASLVIASILPVAVLMVFIAMKYFGVDANIVALSGIAIAIGTMVDLGIILAENIVNHIELTDDGRSLKQRIYDGAAEVSSAILTAVSTTIISFIPVFALEGAEGKLFGPLAFTKTFALIAALIVALLLLPTIAYWLFGINVRSKRSKYIGYSIIAIVGLIGLLNDQLYLGLLILLFSLVSSIKLRGIISSSWVNEGTSLIAKGFRKGLLSLYNHFEVVFIVLAVVYLLANYWLPLGPARNLLSNMLFVGISLLVVLGFFVFLEKYYESILRWCLKFKILFLSIPTVLILWALVIWLGFQSVFGFIAAGFDQVNINIRKTSVWSNLHHSFPGLGEEFMPTLNEGTFLLMPTAMPHAGISYNQEKLAQLDMLVSSIPEVETVVGKLGRVESALDPAPISMFENIIQYRPEYILNKAGRRNRFDINEEGNFLVSGLSYSSKEFSINERGTIYFDPSAYHFLNNDGEILNEKVQEELFRLVDGNWQKHLFSDNDGYYFRNWRPHIKSTDDIWNEISRMSQLPGLTSAPKLQPIETRLIMLQTGMRAPMGIKIFGSDLKTIEDFGEKMETILKSVPSVKPETVFADKIIGKPYLTVKIDREAISRYGLSVAKVQQNLEIAVGGKALTDIINGRERHAVSLRYPREFRNNPEEISQILIDTPWGSQIPLGQLADIGYEKGPQAIKSENTFLVGYVLFDRLANIAEVEVVEAAKIAIQEKIDSGELQVPAGINYEFAGTYENQVRAEKRLSIILPIVLMVVFLILYLQFKSVNTSLMVFAGIAMAFSGGFIMIWFWSQPWFADINIFGSSLRDIFQMSPINLSVAVWVGFIALFGIATDDGVLMATYLDQSFRKHSVKTKEELNQAIVLAGKKRIRPAVMTSATTIIALLPILSSTGKGAEIMIPMAIPVFGGMLFAAISYFIVPLLYAIREERKLKNTLL